MGSKYKKEFEKEWEEMSLRNIKIRTVKIKADRNLSAVINGKFKRRKGVK